MPRIIDDAVAAEAARVLANDLPLLADDDPVGVGANLDGPASSLASTEYLLWSKRTSSVFETAAGNAWKPSNGAAGSCISESFSSW